MVKLEMSGICAGCDKAELRLCDSAASVFEHEWCVLCEHEDACKRVERIKEEEE